MSGTGATGGSEATGGAEAKDGLDPRTTTVAEAVRTVPGANEVFQRFGLDCCCGGELPVAEAAGRHGVDLEGLMEALDAPRAGG